MSFKVTRAARASLRSLAEILVLGRGGLVLSSDDNRTLYEDVARVVRLSRGEGNVGDLVVTPAHDGQPGIVYNPFGTGSVAAVQSMLVALLAASGEVYSRATWGFGERARWLACALAPALVWLRDQKSVPLDLRLVRASFSSRWIRAVVDEQKALLPGAGEHEPREIDLRGEVPEVTIRPLREYLGEVSGSNGQATELGGTWTAEYRDFAEVFIKQFVSDLEMRFPSQRAVQDRVIDPSGVVTGGQFLLVHLPGLRQSGSSALATARFLIWCFEAVASEVLAQRRCVGAEGVSAFPVVLDAGLSSALGDVTTNRNVQICRVG